MRLASLIAFTAIAVPVVLMSQEPDSVIAARARVRVWSTAFNFVKKEGVVVARRADSFDMRIFVRVAGESRMQSVTQTLLFAQTDSLEISLTKRSTTVAKAVKRGGSGGALLGGLIGAAVFLGGFGPGCATVSCTALIGVLGAAVGGGIGGVIGGAGGAAAGATSTVVWSPVRLPPRAP